MDLIALRRQIKFVDNENDSFFLGILVILLCFKI